MDCGYSTQLIKYLTYLAVSNVSSGMKKSLMILFRSSAAVGTTGFVAAGLVTGLTIVKAGVSSMVK